MDTRTEESIRVEISEIEAIRYSERTSDDKRRLNELEAEIRRRHPELQGKFHPAIHIPPYFLRRE